MSTPIKTIFVLFLLFIGCNTQPNEGGNIKIYVTQTPDYKFKITIVDNQYHFKDNNGNDFEFSGNVTIESTNYQQAEKE